MSGRHQEHLSGYLDKHKAGRGRGKTTTETPSKGQPGSSRQNQSKPKESGAEVSSTTRDVPVFFTSQARSRASYMMSRKQHVVRITGNALINSLPDELLLIIFCYLDAGSLIMAARVCQRWLPIAKDKELWNRIYDEFFNTSTGPPSSTGQGDEISRKNLYIKSISSNRNKKAARFLKKISPYTGIPRDVDKALKSIGVYFQITFTDSDKNDHQLNSNDVFFHQMGLCVRWYSFEMPPIKSVREIKVHAINPLFFDKTGKAIWNSPYQRSLLLSYDIDWNKWLRTCKPTGTDDMIKLYTLPDGLTIAVWQRGGEMAFVSVGLHYNQLVKRCLHGTAEEPYDLGTHKVVPDDIDSAYGLHDYQCTVDFHTLRNPIWSQQFQRLLCKKENIGSGYAIFPLIEEEYTHVTFDKNLQFPWKTDAFKGILENVVCIDVTVLDERNTPFCCLSSCTNIAEKNFQKDFDFEFGNDGAFTMSYMDERGKIEAHLRKGDDKKFVMTRLTLKISLDAINAWFGTNYS